MRNTLYPSSKLKALDILLALAERLPDDVKLDRLVPYLIVLLTDEASLVRANAIKTLTQVVKKKISCTGYLFIHLLSSSCVW